MNFGDHTMGCRLADHQDVERPAEERLRVDPAELALDTTAIGRTVSAGCKSRGQKLSLDVFR